MESIQRLFLETNEVINQAVATLSWRYTYGTWRYIYVVWRYTYGIWRYTYGIWRYTYGIWTG